MAILGMEASAGEAPITCFGVAIFREEAGMLKKAVSLATAVAFVVLASVAVCAHEKKNVKKLTKEEVPKPVIAAFEKAHPQAAVKEYEQKSWQDKVWYEVEFKDGGAVKEEKYSADGTLSGSEEKIDAKDLPEAVTKAISGSAPGAKIVKAEKETHGQAVTYEIKLEEKGKFREMKFDEKGVAVKKCETMKKGAK